MSKWQQAKDRARQAQQHLNPEALQHGLDSVQGALTESKIAKVDKKTGKMKMRPTGLVRAAIQPTKTLRRAVDGAAVTDHLQAYGESAAAARRDRMEARGASSAAEFGSYGSKRDYLRDWARRLVVTAGVPPMEQLVAEHAEMAAIGVNAMTFQRLLGAPPEVVNISQYFPGGTEPASPALNTFDALYASMVSWTRQQQAVDEAVVAFLDSCWSDWLQGIRDRFPS